METCLFKNKKICSFDLTDENGKKNLELETVWRIASNKNMLFCDECKETVFLRAGETKIPHFSHKPNFKTNCTKAKTVSTELYLNIKKKFYDSLKGVHELENLEVDKGKYDFSFLIYGSEINITLKKLEDIDSFLSGDKSIFYYTKNIKIEEIKKIVKEPVKIITDGSIYEVSKQDYKVIPLNAEKLKELYSSYFETKKTEVNDLEMKKNKFIFEKKYDLALDFYKAGELLEAEEIFSTLMKTVDIYDFVKPEKDLYLEKIYENLAELYECNEKPELAVKMYTALIDIGLNKSLNLFKRAHLFETLEKFEEAIADYTLLIERGEDHYKERALALVKLGQEEKAFQDLKKVKVLDASLQKLFLDLKEKYDVVIVSLPISKIVGDLFFIQYEGHILNFFRNEIQKSKNIEIIDIVDVGTQLLFEIVSPNDNPTIKTIFFELYSPITGVVKYKNKSKLSVYITTNHLQKNENSPFNSVLDDILLEVSVKFFQFSYINVGDLIKINNNKISVI